MKYLKLLPLLLLFLSCAKESEPSLNNGSHPITLSAGTYSNGIDVTILMPSLAGITTLPLSITNTDQTTVTRIVSLTGASQLPAQTTTIDLSYLQARSPLTLSIQYTPQAAGDTYTADTVMGTPNLILSFTKSHSTLQWSAMVTLAQIHTTSPDGATTFTTNAEQLDVSSTRWNNHPAFQYIKALRKASSQKWHLPSCEEWVAIADNLACLNLAPTTNGRITKYGILPSTDSTKDRIA